MTIQTARAKAEAGFRTQLFNSILPDQLPDNIQWMPPGTQTAEPFVNGEPCPIQIDVTPELADKLNSQLQDLRSRAATGADDVPFLDFNHEDGEAAGEVTELYWAGNDPIKGGIRAKVNWSTAGRAALEGKSYRRFSPAWFLDPETHEPVGIGVNLGGLVNRAAFKNIARVMAKSGRLAPGDNDAELVQAFGKDGAEKFARALAKQLDPLYEAADRIEDLQVQAETRSAIAQARTAATVAGATHPFLVQARALAKQENISEESACIRMAGINYSLYREYMTAVQASASATRRIIRVQKPGDQFISEVKALQAHGMAFDDACSTVSAKRPDLYQGYRTAVTAGLK